MRKKAKKKIKIFFKSYFKKFVKERLEKDLIILVTKVINEIILIRYLNSDLKYINIYISVHLRFLHRQKLSENIGFDSVSDS